MTKKDYYRFAYEIKHQLENEGITENEAKLLVDFCSAVFEADNPLFKRDKFEAESIKRG